jgi:EAL domain-containing protein (putative c-di-GMP-specific phosphodiesterase class I)
VDGTLYLWPPLGHTLNKIAESLIKAELAATKLGDDCLSIDVTPSALHVLNEVCQARLSQVERDQCKYLLLPPGRELTLSDLGRVNSLTHLLAHVTGRWLVELLAERRLITQFQPIVHTSEPENIFAYECLIRGVDTVGKPIMPGKLFDASRDANLLFHLDRAARLQHIHAAEQHNLTTAVFINFNPTSIYDPAFCLSSTIAAIRRTHLDPKQFVFEVVESDRVVDIERLPQILDFYRREGFRVALDDVGAGYSSLNMLSTLRPDFIKLDMHLVRDIDLDPYKAEVVSGLITAAHNLGIQVVAEGIETVGQWNWIANAGADYAQGYLFGKPSAMPVSDACSVAKAVVS